MGLMVVLTGSACVTPTHASSAPSIIIVRVQAGAQSTPEAPHNTPAASLQELVVLYNQSPFMVDLTGWCLVNKSDAKFACFSDTTKGLGFALPAYSYVSVMSMEYAQVNGFAEPDGALGANMAGDYIYETSRQSGGSIVGGANAIKLQNTSAATVDQRIWTSSLPGGSAWVRSLLYTNPDTYSVLGGTADWSPSASLGSPPVGGLQVYELPAVDPDPELDPVDDDGADSSVDPNTGSGNGSPGGPAGDGADTDTVGAVAPVLFITEILPNPKGSDTGAEFIELYNSGVSDISLDGYRIAINKDLTKWINLPSSLSIGAESYMAIYNQPPLSFSLVNTTGYLQLFNKGQPAGNVVTYTSPKDDQSWSLTDDVWVYSKLPTPGYPNSLSSLAEITPKAVTTSAKDPCRQDQYRSPETGRCRLIETKEGPAPCQEGSERNEETGRCRKVVVAAGPTPCKDGYERSAETNRCRKIVKMTKAGHGLDQQAGAAGNQLSWYYWAGIGLVVALVAGYGVWEWRQEITSTAVRVRAIFAKR